MPNKRISNANSPLVAQIFAGEEVQCRAGKADVGSFFSLAVRRWTEILPGSFNVRNGGKTSR